MRSAPAISVSSTANSGARRQQAEAEGRPFMPYKAAQARLRKALVGVAAGDPAPIVKRVFGNRLMAPGFALADRAGLARTGC
jgi:hypothetical protein